MIFDCVSLGTTRAKLLSEDEQLQLVITSKHTSTSDCTENISTRTLEQ
ncbi:unnamed protein product [Musa acuminata subsp. malaccensis]|uniref:(wild Malaysian banana) hypothetical protein n=1 Tax=Musa acuminata subsp. malaccensis TaxID=214687 RepID=A0A804I844_MUSAM|nr:unnamed protein product [Musa acuminata subsp. malaccensis]